MYAFGCDQVYAGLGRIAGKTRVCGGAISMMSVIYLSKNCGRLYGYIHVVTLILFRKPCQCSRQHWKENQTIMHLRVFIICMVGL